MVIVPVAGFEEGEFSTPGIMPFMAAAFAVGREDPAHGTGAPQSQARPRKVGMLFQHHPFGLLKAGVSILTVPGGVQKGEVVSQKQTT